MTMADTRARPGFSNGTEELRWRGKPALRSLVYLWVFSILIAVFVSFYWEKIAGIAYAKLNPAAIDAAGVVTMPSWILLVPWVVFLWPAFVRTLAMALTSYELTNQRLIVKSGIMVRTHDQLELFRVRDFLLDSPFYLVMLGLANVRVVSRDETLPLMTIFAQANSPALIDLIRAEVQRRKDEVGIREIEAGTMH